MSKHLFMNFTLKLFFSQFPPLLLSALINIYNLKFNTLMEILSSTISISILVILPVGLVASFIMLRKYRVNFMLETIQFKERYSGLLSSDHK
jgi:amino acid permease